jgi:phosphatidylglycerophosphate synthase
MNTPHTTAALKNQGIFISHLQPKHTTVTAKTDFRSAARTNHSFTAAVEKRVLIRMAERMPRWVGSDLLTAIGLAGMLGAGICFWLSRLDKLALLGVVVCLVVNWFGDSLDGTLARVRNAQRPRYGFYVDKIADCLGALFLLGGMALSGYMSPFVAAALLIAYYLLSIEVYLTTYTLGAFHMSFGGFGPTELRILLAIGTLWLYSRPSVPMVNVCNHRHLLFDVGGVVAGGGMFLMTLFAAARHARQLYQEEPLPQ